jgi:hypothetical protein
MNARRLIWIGGIATAAGAALVLFFFDPSRFAFYPQCPFHKWTGLDCPGCGGLRALHQLLHGLVLAALRFNAFVVLSVPLGGFFALLEIWKKFRGQSAASAIPIRALWLWMYFGAWMAFAVLRDVGLPLFASLAP